MRDCNQRELVGDLGARCA